MLPAVEQAMSGAVNKMMAAATAPKKQASQTAVTISVDAADRKSLTRAQLAALNRGQVVLARSFDVSVAYAQPEEADELDGETGETPSKA
jgi:glycine cleavage system regulatory protein